MAFRSEWEEPVPQPEPPKRRVRLLRQWEDGSTEPATPADLAAAMGVSLGDVQLLIQHGSLFACHAAKEREARDWARSGQAQQGQSR